MFRSSIDDISLALLMRDGFKVPSLGRSSSRMVTPVPRGFRVVTLPEILKVVKKEAQGVGG